MWVVSTMLPDALKIMEAWGFKYRTVGFYWIKMNQKIDEDEENEMKASFEAFQQILTSKNLDLVIFVILNKIDVFRCFNQQNYFRISLNTILTYK